jgi:ADP-heptose:LPS heptosyltransferase
VPGGAPLVLWQLGASTPIRSYRPDLARRALSGLVQAGCRVVACGLREQVEEYSPLPAGVEVVTGVPVRTLFGLCALAAVTVAPDSVLMHAAGGLRRPCVGLWGSFSPRWRASYYPEHVALVGRGGCPQAPCGTHEVGSQPEGCPRRLKLPPGERYCEALAGIDPARIVAQVLDLLG